MLNVADTIDPKLDSPWKELNCSAVYNRTLKCILQESVNEG